VQIRELGVPGAFELTPVQRADDRGVFMEWYRFDELEAVVGHPLTLRQANTSVSRKGVVRGIHFADVPSGQAKYVMAVRGAALDYVVDLRIGSPAFGRWDSVLLDTVDSRAVYLPEGVGHAFIALTDDATVTYLVSGVYDPFHEHGVNPLDPDIGLIFPLDAGDFLLSPKDADAPGLLAARNAGLLPTWEACAAHYASLATIGR
jgi:dTDP-4-dehydrorhamnose 3,5-epimerase